MSDTTMLLVQDRQQSHHHCEDPSYIQSSTLHLSQDHFVRHQPQYQYLPQHQQGQPQQVQQEQRQQLQNWLTSSFSSAVIPIQCVTVQDLDDCSHRFVTPDLESLVRQTRLLVTERVSSVGSPELLHQLQTHVPTQLRSSQLLGLMQSARTVAPGSWQYTLAHEQLTPNSTQSHRGHRRESSLSSVGSAGPASPYNYSTAHPQIILPSDSAGSEIYYDGLPSFEHTPYHIFPKSLTPPHAPQTESFLYGCNSDYHPGPGPLTFMATQKQQPGEVQLMQPPEFSHLIKPSVSSSHETPATPPEGEISEEQSVKIEYRAASTIPKLDRTMSDVYNDELYSPTFAFSSAPTSQPAQTTMLSPSQSDIFTQRLQAANSQHLSASAQSPVANTGREKSPFRQGSPLAPAVHTFASPQVRLGSAQQMREQQKAENDAQALQKQMRKSSPDSQSTPKTISPKDALLDYHETEDDASRPLFPPQSTRPRTKAQGAAQPAARQQPSDSISSDASDHDYAMATGSQESLSTYSTSSQPQPTPKVSGFSFVPPAVPGGVQVPQHYPFVPQHRRQTSNMSAVSSTPEFPSTLTSMESSSSEYAPEQSELRKPSGTTADGGTYTCTYHGCTLRFETPAKLQKHKREGHRQSAPLSAGAGGARDSDSASPDGGGEMTSAALLRNSQAGPHKCERINPSTGKPCNTIFSRPYDLTRHEDTIHNARKQKVRCQLCTEEKTFSRNDALTRHMRVVHPEVDFPGKTRRRAHD